MHASQYSFGRASAQGIDEIEMSLGCEHHQVRTPLTLSFYDLLYHIALSNQGIMRPSGAVRRRKHRCGLPLADVNQTEFSHDTIQAPCQKCGFAKRRLCMRIMIERDKDLS